MEQIYTCLTKTALNMLNFIADNGYLLVLRFKIFAELMVVMFVAELGNHVL